MTLLRIKESEDNFNNVNDIKLQVYSCEIVINRIYKSCV